jgi:hypothetical protein
MGMLAALPRGGNGAPERVLASGLTTRGSAGTNAIGPFPRDAIRREGTAKRASTSSDASFRAFERGRSAKGRTAPSHESHQAFIVLPRPWLTYWPHLNGRRSSRQS